MINDKLTQALADAVKQVISPESLNESFTLDEGKMKELHALMKKGVKDPKKIAKELGLANTKEVHSAIEALIKTEYFEPNGGQSKAVQDVVAMHAVDVEDHLAKNKKESVKEAHCDDDRKDEELSAKQKKIDLNKNGKVDGDDLAQLRKKAKKEDVADDEEDAMDANKKELEKSLPKQVKKESVEFQEGKFDKLEKKLGSINPETLGDVMDGKIKLNSAEKKEFDEFMKGVRKMFGESVELQEAASFGDIEKVMKWAKKNIVGPGKFPQLDISKKYGTAFINLTIMNVITLRLGGKKGIVVTHDDRRSGSGKAYEEHFSNANGVIKFVEKLVKAGIGNSKISKDESVTDDEGEAMDANKKELEKSLPKQVKEALSKNAKTAGFKGRDQFDLSDHLEPLVKKNKSLKSVYFDGPDLVGETPNRKSPTIAKGVLTDPKMTVADLEKAVKNFKESATYSEELLNKILEKKNLEEATDLFDKGKISLTRFSMGKGKLGLQINYGMKYIQVPEKEINTLLTGLNTAFKNFKKGLGESIEEITEETFNMFFDGYDSDWHYLKQDAKKMRAKLTNIETQFGDEYYFTMDTTKSNLKKLLKKYGDLELEESVNKEEIQEAIQPKDFIKGGDKKLSSNDVGDVMDRIFLNDRMMKQLEKTGAFKEGKKDKGKKKNPFKKDTIDFHHYELGVDAGQAGF